MRHILLAATALAMLSGAAYAQDSNSNSRSTAINSSGSQSSSVSNPKVTVIGNPIGNGASSSTSGARATANTRSSSRSAAVGNTTTVTVEGYAGVSNSGTTTGTGTSGGTSAGTSAGTAAGTGASGDPSYGVNYSGGYTVRNTPEVIPPSVVGGNACAVGASAGMSVAGFGIAGGATWADRACERRQQAALLFNFGKQKAATELLCQDDNVRNALRMSGEPCVADAAGSAPAVAAAAPATIVAAAPAPAAVATPTKHARPEWCWTASPAELRNHRECDLKS